MSKVQIAKNANIGSGHCFVGHSDVPAGAPKDFMTAYSEPSKRTVYIENQPIATVGTTGHTDCGHTSIALTGSSTVFAEKLAVHRVNDIGSIVEGTGLYAGLTGSNTVWTN